MRRATVCRSSREDLDEGLLRITGPVEKPKVEDAPSAFAAIGGYVITPGVIDELREQTKRWYEHRTGEVHSPTRSTPMRRAARCTAR